MHTVTRTARVFPWRRRGLPILLLTLTGSFACLGTGTEDTAVRRGDVAFAADSLEEALAEYRLAVRQGNGDAPTLARVAHTYASLNRVDEAADFYRAASLADSTWADQAAADLLHLARVASSRRDHFLMATAVQEAVSFRPGLGLGELALPLARHYFRNGEYGRALPLYQRAAERADSVPRMLFEIGQAYEEIGDCRRALIHFEEYREMAPRAEWSGVDWYIGSCAFEVARELRISTTASRAELEEALVMVNRTLDVGEPRNLQGQAWFERGEIQAALGACDEAMESFAQVRFVEPGGSGALVNRAQERFDLLKFGRGLDRFRDDGRCY
jgi:tetratricopeptide (TPR) repeat protein